MPLHCRLPVGTLRARRLRSTRPYEHSARNLAAAGYTGYEKLLLKPQDVKVHAVEFKSGERQKLEDAGYVIVGNIGDQWSDLLGAPEGARTFKLPDPMYYVG